MRDLGYNEKGILKRDNLEEGVSYSEKLDESEEVQLDIEMTDLNT